MTYDNFKEQWQSEKNYLICHTSGSTGTPKEIHLAKETMEQSALRTNQSFHIDEKSYLHSCISPDFIGGKMMMIRSLIAGSEFGWEIPSNKPLNDYFGRDITLLAVVPSQMHFILDKIASLPSIQYILIGGAPIPPALRKRIAESGLIAYESYGMTETASHIALRKVETEVKPFRTLDAMKASFWSILRYKLSSARSGRERAIPPP